MDGLLLGITSLTWQQVVMMLVGGGLIYLAISKEYEPALLLPIGFGAILANIPFSAALDQMNGGVKVEGILNIFFNSGIFCLKNHICFYSARRHNSEFSLQCVQHHYSASISNRPPQ